MGFLLSTISWLGGHLLEGSWGLKTTSIWGYISLLVTGVIIIRLYKGGLLVTGYCMYVGFPKIRDTFKYGDRGVT